MVYDSRPHAYGSHLETHSAAFTEAVQWISYKVNFFFTWKGVNPKCSYHLSQCRSLIFQVTDDCQYEWLTMSTGRVWKKCGFGLWFGFLGLLGQNFISAVVILDGINPYKLTVFLRQRQCFCRLPWWISILLDNIWIIITHKGNYEWFSWSTCEYWVLIDRQCMFLSNIL